MEANRRTGANMSVPADIPSEYLRTLSTNKPRTET
jgi:hypothetical protein